MFVCENLFNKCSLINVFNKCSKYKSGSSRDEKSGDNDVMVMIMIMVMVMVGR